MHIELLLLFFTVAAIYASAGFGGGSSYLAVMALYGISMTTMRPTSLMCNIVVVLGGTYIFWQKGYLNFKKILPLSIASVPMAFIGGLIPLEEKAFMIVLGCTLVVAAAVMFQAKSPPAPPKGGSLPHYLPKGGSEERYTPPLWGGWGGLGGLLGGIIGFLSGMVGIGGGIFLSPVLHLLKWDTPKHIAATASFFILINSIAGLIGQLIKTPQLDWQFVLPLMGVVFLGGQVGSRLSAFKFNQVTVKRVTAIVIFYAGVNILWHNL